MGHKIRAQLGKTNVAGTGNYINQIGNGNQNNTTVIHYYNTKSDNQSDGGVIALLGIFVIFIFTFVNHLLFKYANYIMPVIKYMHAIFFVTLVPMYKLYSHRDLDTKDIVNLLTILFHKFHKSALR